MRGIKRNLPEDEIVRLYVEEMWSIMEIANHFSVGYTMIHNRLIKYSIKRRGYTHDARGREKISKALRGKFAGEANPMFGKSHSLTVRQQISNNRIKSGVAKGENNPNYKHGKCMGDKSYQLHRSTAMQTLKYREWRRQVFERDNYTCQDCDKRGGDLHADHIKPWAYYPKLRYKVSNGRALCIKCHRARMKETLAYGIKFEKAK